MFGGGIPTSGPSMNNRQGGMQKGEKHCDNGCDLHAILLLKHWQQQAANFLSSGP